MASTSRYLVILLLAAASFLNRVVGDTFTRGWPICSKTDNYTMDSQYQLNLSNVTANLAKRAFNNGGFLTTTAGEAPDMVFGHIMCYADRDSTKCEACVLGATSDIQQVCPLSREARACYEDCVLRYSNESFFSVADLTIAWYVVDPIVPVADSASMNGTRWKLMSQLAGDATRSQLRLANGSRPYMDSLGQPHVLYGLAQCTRDLIASECSRCLTEFVAQLAILIPDNTYGTVKGYSCYMAYRVDTELSITILQPPRAEPPPPPSTTPLPLSPPFLT